MENFKLGSYVLHKNWGGGQILGIDHDSCHDDPLGRYLCVFGRTTGLTLTEGTLRGYKRVGIDICDEIDESCINHSVAWCSGDSIQQVDMSTAVNNWSKKIETKKEEVKPVFVRRFASGAIRSDDRGREKPSFVSPYAITEIAKHFSKNASFFNGNDSGKNYMKGIKPEDIQDSLERHVLEFKENMMPFKYDRDKVKQNLVEIAANCVMALHQIVMEEKGEYVEKFEGTEYIERDKAYDQ